MESRVTPSRVRFRYVDAVIGTLRRAGFSIELAYKAQLAIESYIYGFTLQEVSWPFEPEEQRDLAAALQLQIAPDEYPYLTEMMNWIIQARVTQKDNMAYESEFEFGLDLILDGLERLRQK